MHITFGKCSSTYSNMYTYTYVPLHIQICACMYLHVYIEICIDIHVDVYIRTSCTKWRRLIGSPKLQIIFHKRAIKYRLLLRKMTCTDKGSYESSPPYSSERCRVHVSVVLRNLYKMHDTLCLFKNDRNVFRQRKRLHAKSLTSILIRNMR